MKMKATTFRLLSKLTCGALLIAAIGSVAEIPALAQNVDRSGHVTQPGSNISASPAVDDSTLEKVARAYLRVQKITEQEGSKMKGSERSDASDQQVAERAESEKLAAVKAQGLEPQQYNRVLMMVDNDKDLKARFVSCLAKLS